METEQILKPTFNQVILHRRFSKKSTKEEIIELEKEFQNTNKIEDPVKWFRLQEELGLLYKRLMKYYQ